MNSIVEYNAKQKAALDAISNFILYYTSDEMLRERMVDAACDYIEQDHYLATQVCGACGADIEAWDRTVQFEDSVYHDFCCE